MIEAFGHRFRPYGGEEMICTGCDFVIWSVESASGAEKAVRMLNGDTCPRDSDTHPKDVAQKPSSPRNSTHE